MTKEAKKFLIVIALTTVAAGFVVALPAEEAPPNPDSGLRITILYDNYAAKEGVRTDWGFACLIEGLEKTILFDAGTDPKILEYNVRHLEVDLSRIDLVVISHLHGDHTGGLPFVLSQKSGIPVYLPGTAQPKMLEAQSTRIADRDSRPVPVGDPREICPNVRLTGSLPGEGGSANDEQAIVIDTSGGLVVITGCAHPGIVKIVKRAADILPKKPTVVMGGFHLGQKSEGEVLAIIEDLKAAGVRRCGATHCTGDGAIELFKREFGEDYIPLGVGRVLTLAK